MHRTAQVPDSGLTHMRLQKSVSRQLSCRYDRGMEQLVARKVHTLEVAGPIPAPATKKLKIGM